MTVKTFGALLCYSVLLFSICLQRNTLAQNQPAQPQPSSLTEIVESLNKTGFSSPQISLEFEGGEAYAGNDPASSMNLMLSRQSEWAIFSPGFKVDSLNGCHLKLKNDQVKILKWYQHNTDPHFMSLAKFVVDGRKGEKKLTPKTGVLFIPLNKLKYKRSTAPEYNKHSKTWNIKFEEKGFFRRSIISMRITAAEGDDLTSTMTARRLNFMFEDKKEAEDFNVALRQAIQLCSGK